MRDSNEFFEFKESASEQTHTQKKWKILTVEDDLNYQQALLNSFNAISFDDNQSLEVLTANSVSEASSVLSRHKDIAIVFLDVVMEEDDSGLRLVNTIRHVLGNNDIRIVLLTGQPSFAPEPQVMQSLDIDEYWNKSDMTVDKLKSIVSSHLRTYQYISQISNAKQGLQLVLDAARSINSKHDIRAFSHAVLDEIGKILHLSKGGGVLCVGNEKHFDKHPKVLTSIGCFRGLDGKDLSTDLLSEEAQQSYILAREKKEHVFSEHYSVFYFDTSDVDISFYITIVKSDTPIDEHNVFLLKVFSENVSTGFSNIALMNRLTELAYTDITLNMPNRNWLQREIDNMNKYEQAETQLVVFEILQFDEKSFRFGHDFCKKTHLKMRENILQALAPYHPRIAVFKSDSLGVLVSSHAFEDESIVDSLKRQSFEIDGVRQFLDVRILVMQLIAFEQHNAEQIFNLAESTLNEENTQRAELLYYTLDNTKAITRRYELMQELRTAIRNKELQVALQPKVNLTTNEVVGFEALARWQRDDGTFVRPDEFIELAETAGLISELDKLIFDKIMQTIKKFAEQGVSLPIAFNASTFDLLADDYFVEIAARIEEYDISPSLLELEVTETQAIFDYEKINACLCRFAGLGIKISIDDFGTGYSSLAHISEIPAQIIKIDRCFVTNIQESKSNQHIIEMIMLLADKFGFEVTAEGIETEAEHNWLIEAGCNIGQGYYYAKPMFYDDALQWLKGRSK
ncbi:EAL domain-containing protein [Pseudoalteromonas sp. Isolate3]|uniref:GGDEF/EAL domain-containing response regulator n=1 Tax=Pseudoalteromonas sp. Isolate3 TaxID=2908526 RepID=UPI001EFE5FDD|nr:EAL domain-containing protein [Pseudoalteromonas sp. Isolate3]MCG9707526.1 EAL domain-containing protein [Pseudoalteromonas sp. Isolate3]